jgi:diguanylate cyclase (GGDEF)-like protein
MRDSIRSNAPTALFARACEFASQRLTRRPIFLTCATLAAVFVCAMHAAVAGRDTVRASGFGYLTLSLVLFGCALAFWTRARSAQPTLYVRWAFLSAGALAAALGYFPSFTQAIFNTGPERWFQTASFNASEALYMLAAVLFCAGAGRLIVVADVFQALLFTILRFNLIYSPVTRDHFNVFHLALGQMVAFYLFVVAVVACLGAASRAEMRLLRTLSCFLGIRFVSFFLANQVCYTWLHHINCGLWDVPGPALLAGFALYLLYTGHSADADVSQIALLRPPSVTVRNLMPSFLTFVNLMLGLLVLRISLTLAASAISLSLICYVARTVLLQAHAAREKASLESRNVQLEGLATRDPLTGIGNRRSLAGVYGKLQASAGRENLSILLMDIDRFKQANDCHGHPHGDKILVVLAKKLEELSSRIAGSHCARFGGDEFALLLLNVSPQKASALAEELRVSFSEHDFQKESGRVSLSIGLASLQSAHDLPLEHLISHADHALYRAKQLGRNRVEILPPDEIGTLAENPKASSMAMQLQQNEA